MTEEVDPRLIALGLVPAPPGWREQQQQWQQPLPAATDNEPSSVFASATVTPEVAADLFPGMGRFTGMPAESPPQAAPSHPLWEVPAPPPPIAEPQRITEPQWMTVSDPPPPAAESAAADLATAAAPLAPVPAPDALPADGPAPFAAAATIVAPPAPEAPVREAPPPLPPLAAAMPTATVIVAEAPATPKRTKEKERKEKKQRLPKASVRGAEKAEAPAKVEKPKAVPKPRYQLPASGVLLRGPVVMGYPEKTCQITLEQLGFRINAKDPVEVPWSGVKKIESRRGRVIVRVKNARPVAFGIPVEGVSEPTLAGPLARVVKEASGGSLDLAGSAFLELQNATDSLRDRFHDEDDPLIPTVVGLVFVLAGLTVTALLPDMLAIATRSAIAPGAFLLDAPLAAIDPRILAASFAAGAMLAAGVVRIAMGKSATGWARGTLRGWHGSTRPAVNIARRMLAAIVLSPAIAAAVLLISIFVSLPSTRVQTVIDRGGFHLTRELPFFDEDRAWATVIGIQTVPAPTSQHFEGFAVVFTFQDRSPISTLDSRLRGGTDKQLQNAATAWRDGRAP